MNKLWPTLCLALITATVTEAQNQKAIDSLRTELLKTRDTTKVQVLISLCQEFRDAVPENALKYGLQALALAETLDYGIGIVDSYTQLGIIRERQGKFQEAIDFYLLGVKVSQKFDDQIGEQYLLNNIGIAYKEQSDYKLALEYYLRAVEICQKIDYQRGLASVYNNIAVIYKAQARYADALRYYLSAIEIREESGDKYGLVISFNGLALLYKIQGDTAKALTFYKRSLQTAEDIQNQVGIAGISSNIGELYKSMGYYQQALAYNKTALKIHKQLNFKNNVVTNLNNIGSIYALQQQFDRSLEYYNEALSIQTEGGNQANLAESYQNIARVYMAQGNLHQALDYASKGLEIALGVPFWHGVKNGYELLTQIHGGLGDFEKAYGYQNDLIGVSDSIFNLEKSRQLAELQTLYETERKEKEIALLETQQEQARSKYIMVVAGLAFSIVAGLLVVMLQRLKIRKNKKLLMVQQENAELKEKELQQKLEFKNKELTTQSLNLVQKNGIMEELKSGINEIIEVSDKVAARKINSLKRLIDYSFHLDKDWERFKMHFEQVHKSFFTRLMKEFPDLTTSERRLCALIKLSLSTKEMATIMGISPESMKVARHRLRKKMGLAPEANLAKVLLGFDA